MYFKKSFFESRTSSIVFENSCEADDSKRFESHLDHLLVVVEALAAVSTWGANNLFPIKLNYLLGILD